MHAIESAAFIVCLDDARLEGATAVERCFQFLYADGSNRWYDKTLQLIICENGTSASVCEYSAINDFSIVPLHQHINRAIFEYDPQPPAANNIKDSGSIWSIEELPLSTKETVKREIVNSHRVFKAATSKHNFAFLDEPSLGSDFLGFHKCPVQSAVQLAVQLACRRFYGYSPPAMETVSMAHFRRGCIEINQIIQPAVAAFLTRANDAATATSPQDLRPLFYDAARAHAKSLSRASKGRGFNRHLLALEWMLREGEGVPTLFRDPAYAKMKPGKVMTSNADDEGLEGGIAYPIPESIFVCFDVKGRRWVETITLMIIGWDDPC